MVQTVVERVLATGVDDAYHWLVDYLKRFVAGTATQSGGDAHGSYGYDLSMPLLGGDYGRSLGVAKTEESQKTQSHLAACMYDALWELCKRGVLRSSPNSSGNVSNTPPGYGYSITEQGRQWLSGSGFEPVLIASGGFAKLLASHSAKYGDDYLERCQEAVRCFDAGAYLACCVMCGAATESIFLAMAVAKTGDEASVLSAYNKPNGRRNLELMLKLPQHVKSLQNEVMAAYNIMKYWRDNAAHGAAANIDVTEAQVALHLLYLYAINIDKHWSTLTAP